ncbi:MAG: hypothetical protein P4M11_03875 [Candidatus Pacebacteria bacterium]|nr:hypothetical protein [Candidatus Paceibacterota bacterium]
MEQEMDKIHGMKMLLEQCKIQLEEPCSDCDISRILNTANEAIAQITADDNIKKF